MIPLSVREIFETIQADQERDYQVTVSYIEVSAQLKVATIGIEYGQKRRHARNQIENC